MKETNIRGNPDMPRASFHSDRRHRRTLPAVGGAEAAGGKVPAAMGAPLRGGCKTRLSLKGNSERALPSLEPQAISGLIC
jgi:hypothetical protein